MQPVLQAAVDDPAVHLNHQAAQQAGINGTIQADSPTQALLQFLLQFRLLPIRQRDNAAHIGGLIGGILTSLALGVTDKTRKADKINGLIVLALYFTFIIYICFVGVPI